MYLWVDLWIETLGKNFIPEGDLGINFAKTLIKKMKNCIKNRKKCVAQGENA